MENKKLNKLELDNNFVFYIDNISFGIRHLIINGWTVSTETKNEVDIKTRSLVKINRYPRIDVNKDKNLNDEYKSGFEISCCPFLPIKIRFIDGKKIKTFKVNGTKLFVLRILVLLKKVFKSIKNDGLKMTLFKIKNRLNDNNAQIIEESYHDWFMRHRVTKEELNIQRNIKFTYNPLISIVVPTYNTPKVLLNEMIESIRNQTYTNWELCIADGKSSNKETIKELKEYIKKDNRIKVVFLDENHMISGNTNQAINIATGEFVALMDHDDIIEPNTLFEYVKYLNEDNSIDFIYCDEDKVNEEGTEYFHHHFKPDFAIDNLRGNNYITHFSMIRKSVLDAIGPFDSQCDGAQDYDMILRVVDYTKNIVHISKPLYHWRVTNQSTSQGSGAKPYVIEAGRRAVEKHLERNNIKGVVENAKAPCMYRIKYELIDNPLISIIIPNKDHVEDLKKCIKSILKKTTYENYEIIIVENNSEDDNTFNYYNELEKNPKIRVVYWKGPFNFSGINNYGVKFAKGEQLLLLNNDVEVISPDWLQEMLMFSQRSDVGAVGALLYYEDNTIQHGGTILGLGGIAGHAFLNIPRGSPGYAGRLFIPQDYTCVTAACLMVKRSIYEEVGGLEEKFAVAFNDVDFCMKIRRAGYLNVFTPYAELYHYESKSRGSDLDPDKIERFKSEINLFESIWKNELEKGDPFYNPNFTMNVTDGCFTVRKE